MNLIEFVHLKFDGNSILFSEKFIEELDNNDIGRAFANPTAFVSKLFSGKSNFRSRD